MTDPMLVSVVVPCFNQARFLDECIGGLQAQSHEHWEAIIVNDGSTDETRAEALRLGGMDPRVRYVEQENRGLSGARNAGIRAARGEFFQFLDADDTLEPDKLRLQLGRMVARPEIDIVYGDVRYFTSDRPLEREIGPYAREPGQPWVGPLWQEPGNLLSKLVRGNIMAVNCPMLRRDVFARVGLWDESLRALEDWEFWVRCAAAGMVFEYFDPAGSWALVRMHPESMTRDLARMQRAALEFRVRTAKAFAEPADALCSARKATQAADALGHSERLARYRRIYSAHSQPEARRLIVRQFLFGPASPWTRKAPWPMQRALARLLGE